VVIFNPPRSQGHVEVVEGEMGPVVGCWRGGSRGVHGWMLVTTVYCNVQGHIQGISMLCTTATITLRPWVLDSGMKAGRRAAM
jgi:hypothetical protein